MDGDLLSEWKCWSSVAAWGSSEHGHKEESAPLPDAPRAVHIILSPLLRYIAQTSAATNTSPSPTVRVAIGNGSIEAGAGSDSSSSAQSSATVSKGRRGSKPAPVRNDRAVAWKTNEPRS